MTQSAAGLQKRSEADQLRAVASGSLRTARVHFEARNHAETELEKLHYENQHLKARIAELEGKDQ